MPSLQHDEFLKIIIFHLPVNRPNTSDRENLDNRRNNHKFENLGLRLLRYETFLATFFFWQWQRTRICFRPRILSDFGVIAWLLGTNFERFRRRFTAWDLQNFQKGPLKRPAKVNQYYIIFLEIQGHAAKTPFKHKLANQKIGPSSFI